MSRQLDAVFVNYNAPEIVYQDLANKWSAIEPPSWSIMLANACRKSGYGVAIIDADAEKLTYEQTIEKIKYLNPRLVVFPVYGANPNASCSNMWGNTNLAEKLKSQYPQFKIMFLGTHTSALPLEVLAYDYIDLVGINEGIRTLKWLLATDLETDLHTINGLGWKDNEDRLHLNEGKGSIVPDGLLDEEIPRGGYDLLPYKNKPLDLYRAHWWHAEFKEENTRPFMAIYSSLGCKFSCSFCQINAINREDTGDTYIASHSNIMRYWSTKAILDDIGELVKLGVKTLRFSDELLYYNKKHYEPLLNGIIERGYDIRFWAYGKVNTIYPKFLDLFKKAGCNYLAIGYEAIDQSVRKAVDKGLFKEVDVEKITEQVHKSGLNIIQNWIVGLPTQDEESVKRSYDMACRLNCSFMNVYPAQALPPSLLWYEARQNGKQLPTTFSEYSFLGYDSLPLSTDKLTSADILRLRDKFWSDYMQRPEYLSMVQSKFGTEAKNNIVEMSKIKLKRRLLET